jgi:hypothetical protein
VVALLSYTTLRDTIGRRGRDLAEAALTP